jgi:hypothetical protein
MANTFRFVDEYYGRRDQIMQIHPKPSVIPDAPESRLLCETNIESM